VCGGAQVGAGLPLSVGVSGLAILMGLNLLEVVIIPLPSLDVDTRGVGLPAPVQVRHTLGTTAFPPPLPFTLCI
jgi:hypothetical protein